VIAARSRPPTPLAIGAQAAYMTKSPADPARTRIVTIALG